MVQRSYFGSVVGRIAHAQHGSRAASIRAVDRGGDANAGSPGRVSRDAARHISATPSLAAIPAGDWSLLGGSVVPGGGIGVSATICRVGYRALRPVDRSTGRTSRTCKTCHGGCAGHVRPVRYLDRQSSLRGGLPESTVAEDRRRHCLEPSSGRARGGDLRVHGTRLGLLLATMRARSSGHDGKAATGHTGPVTIIRIPPDDRTAVAGRTAVLAAAVSRLSRRPAGGVVRVAAEWLPTHDGDRTRTRRDSLFRGLGRRRDLFRLQQHVEVPSGIRCADLPYTKLRSSGCESRNSSIS